MKNKGKSARLTSAALFICLFALTLCGCAKSENEDIFFIHAVGFDADSQSIRMSVLLEESQGSEQKGSETGVVGSQSEKEKDSKKQDYFTDSFTGKTAKECTKQLYEKYKSCYFGRSEIYIFSDSLSRRAFYDIAVFVSSSPLLSAQSSAVSVSKTSAKSLLLAIGDSDSLKQIKDIAGTDKTNVIKFFCLCTKDGYSVSIPSVTLSEQNEVIFEKNTVYKNCAISAK